MVEFGIVMITLNVLFAMLHESFRKSDVFLSELGKELSNGS